METRCDWSNDSSRIVELNYNNPTNEDIHRCEVFIMIQKIP